jgi:Putative prokaryotic signal transducing protein
MKSAELIVISTFRSVTDATIAKGILDAAGIESAIRSDNAGGMYPALAGADLLVRKDDSDKAIEALQIARRRDQP